MKSAIRPQSGNNLHLFNTLALFNDKLRILRVRAQKRLAMFDDNQLTIAT